MEFTPVFDDSSSHTLFSTFITIYILFILYSPSILWRALFSPVLLIAATLLLTLLRSGAGDPSRPDPEKEEERTYPTQVSDDLSLANNSFEESFVEWDVKAPLEVIYEGDEDSNQNSDLDSDKMDEAQFAGHPSLSMCYPETDQESGSSTDGDFSVIGDWISEHDFSFGWCNPELNHDQDGLIEIALKSYGDEMMGNNLEEEDNFIEIDIFPARRKEILDQEMADTR